MTFHARHAGILALGAALAWPVAAWSVVGPVAMPAPAPSGEPVDVPTCKETFPAGAARPKVTETFPARGKTGYALPLELVIAHGKGETVLPGGIGGETTGDASRALEAAGFYLPSAKGGSAPTLETTTSGDGSTTHLTISVVALPKKPGRTEISLPPLPIAMARASGEVRTLCTSAHTILLEDPTANTPDAKPKGNPRGRRQIEEWTAAKHATIGAVTALLLGALGAWLLSLWRRRPKAVPPPPPPRPPWEVALEELFDVRIAQLVEQGRFAEHFDRVSDAVRRYLGARYGFDGLETTTREAMGALRRVTPRLPVLSDVEAFLENADLVKFAKLSPTEAECHQALSGAEDIVHRTVPPSDPQPMSATLTMNAPRPMNAPPMSAPPMSAPPMNAPQPTRTDVPAAEPPKDDGKESS